MQKLKRLHAHWYAELSRPVGRFTQFDLCGVAVIAGALLTMAAAAGLGLL